MPSLRHSGLAADEPPRCREIPAPKELRGVVLRRNVRPPRGAPRAGAQAGVPKDRPRGEHGRPAGDEGPGALSGGATRSDRSAFGPRSDQCGRRCHGGGHAPLSALVRRAPREEGSTALLRQAPCDRGHSRRGAVLPLGPSDPRDEERLPGTRAAAGSVGPEHRAGQRGLRPRLSVAAERPADRGSGWVPRHRSEEDRHGEGLGSSRVAADGAPPAERPTGIPVSISAAAGGGRSLRRIQATVRRGRSGPTTACPEDRDSLPSSGLEPPWNGLPWAKGEWLRTRLPKGPRR